jgi:asparagine synthase (glutamine-hydrolysing)
MCGIAGKVCATGTVDPALVDRMAAVLEHRGPDSRGTFLGDGVGLAVRRLAVIDLAHGDQPIYNEDGSVVAILNGEIYNHPVLRTELLRRGHRFSSQTDAEVIVHLYEERGDELVLSLRGMFAFALWDRKRRRLLIGRDRVGKKPLFYADIDSSFWFASEAKAILEDEAVPRTPDHVAIDTYLHYQYVPHPRSAFAALRKLSPAHVLTYQEGVLRTRRYWRLSYRRRLAFLTDPELHELIRARLLEATCLRLRSDVPVGALLSGGVDSSSVVAAMARLTSQTIKTFAIGFDVGNGDDPASAREVARLFSTEHSQIVLDASALDVFPRLVWHNGEPFADSSAIACYHLAALARQHVTVALAGDGGDEDFAGYKRYAKVSAYDGPTAPRAGLRASDRHLVPFYSDLVSSAYFGASLRRMLYTPEFLAELEHQPFLRMIADPYHASDADDPLGRILDVDTQTYLPDDILVKVDITSMAHALEVRSPLLDHVFMQTAAAIPSERKLAAHPRDGVLTAKTRTSVQKRIFKESLREWLPNHILDRPKVGFSVPIREWLRAERRDLAREVLLDPRALDRGMFREQAVRSLIEDHVAGRADNAGRIWALLQLELWLRTYVDGRRVGAPAVIP